MSLDEILARYLEQIVNGDAPEREALIANHPEHATELREFFADQDRFHDALKQAEHKRQTSCLPLDNSDSAPTDQFNKDALEDDFQKSRVIGNYKLLQRIGAGGMGEVWMAEQEKPIRRRVALKLIKAGMDSKQVVARFEAERQALAMMDHQNIAKVLDAGTTEDKRPYFVMELVQGIPFTQYCDKNKLSITDRLILFIPVCHAIQHAHQKGVIHRDLKPSNILITLYDGKPVPKVIDFGLAKALQHQSKLTDRTLFTEFGQVVGTLQYMSPEQAEMNALDVDTRTDIYSLGVMLYELLTGSTPIDRDTLQQQAVFKVLETIREKDPPKPSARLSSSGDKVTGISQQRQIDPKKLTDILKGDLDWIAMKALEKDRTRRYATASSLAEDISRFLSGDAIEARPPSTAYKLQKFVRKNKRLVASTAIVFTALLLGIIGTSIGFWRAESLRKVAVQQTKEAKDARTQSEKESARAKQSEIRANEEAQKAKQAEAIAESEAQKAIASSNELESSLARSNFYLAHSRWNEGRCREARDLLWSIPDRYRNIEWGLSQRMFEGSYATLYGHLGAVTCVAFSPDGTRVASGSWDHTIKIWDATTGEELVNLYGHENSVRCLSFSPDGTRLASSSDETIKIWDTNIEAEIVTLTGHKEEVACVDFNSDGTLLASGADNIKIWNATKFQELSTVGDFYRSIWSTVDFSPDGECIASSRGDDITIWDLKSGKERVELEGNESNVYCVSFSPDGTRLASGSWESIKIWDIINTNESLTLSEDEYGVNNLSFSPDGDLLASGSFDKTIKVWNTKRGVQILTLKGHEDSVNWTMFSPDNKRIVSASDDETVRLWDITDSNELLTLKSSEHSVYEAGFSPTGEHITTASSDKTIKLWNVLDGTEASRFQGRVNWTNSLKFSPTGTQLACALTNNRIELWDLRKLSGIFTPHRHREAVEAIAYSTDGDQLATGSKDGELVIWDTRTGNKINSISLNECRFRCLCFKPRSSSVAVALTDGTARLWDFKSGEFSKLLNQQEESVGKIVFSPDGTTFACTSSNSAKIWIHKDHDELLTLQGHESQIESITFSRDNSRLATSSEDCTVKLWDTSNGKELLTLKAHKATVNCISFDSENSRLVSASDDGNIKLWDSTASSRRLILKQHGAQSVRCLCLSSDTKSLASTDGETIIVWDTLSGKERLKLDTHTAPVHSVRFSNNCMQLVSTSSDGTVNVWDLNTGKILLTLTGHRAWNADACFSEDDKFIYFKGSSETENVEYLAWDIVTGKRLNDANVPSDAFNDDSQRNGQLVAFAEGHDVAIIDLFPSFGGRIQAFRRAKARLDPRWHQEMAEKAESASNWFSAAFHRAWQIQAGNDSILARFLLNQDIAGLHDASIPKVALEVIATNSAEQLDNSEIGEICSRIGKRLDMFIKKHEPVPDDELALLKKATELATYENLYVENMFEILSQAYFTRRQFREGFDALHEQFLRFSDINNPLHRYKFSLAVTMGLEQCTSFWHPGLTVNEVLSRISSGVIAELEKPLVTRMDEDHANVIANDVWTKLIQPDLNEHITPETPQLDQLLTFKEWHSHDITQFPRTTLFELLTLACDQHPSKWNWSVKGAFYYRYKRYEEAIDALEKTSQLPSNSEDADKKFLDQIVNLGFLALAHQAAGHNENANQYHNQFQELLKAEDKPDADWLNDFEIEVNAAFASVEAVAE